MKLQCVRKDTNVNKTLWKHNCFRAQNSFFCYVPQMKVLHDVPCQVVIFIPVFIVHAKYNHEKPNEINCKEFISSSVYSDAIFSVE